LLADGLNDNGWYLFFFAEQWIFFLSCTLKKKKSSLLAKLCCRKDEKQATETWHIYEKGDLCVSSDTQTTKQILKTG